MSLSKLTAERWIQFLRTYSPQTEILNQYEEHNRRRCRRLDIEPISFVHPLQQRAIDTLAGHNSDAINLVLLTGTAGDGKTRIVHEVWKSCGGDEESLMGSDNFYSTTLANGRRLNLIRDMTALKPDDGGEWNSDHLNRLERLCAAAINPEPNDEVFLIATNDGQFLEAMIAGSEKLPNNQLIQTLYASFERLLVEDLEQLPGLRLRCINMSSQSSAVIFDLALQAILTHQGWSACIPSDNPDVFFGTNCYVRKNFEIIQTELFQRRLRSIVQLCDLNEVHLSVREIFMLISNALLGNTAADSSSHGIPKFSEIERIIKQGKSHCGNIYSNVLGGNLKARGRRTHLYDSLDRFQIGYETTNLVDTMLIFGKGDPDLEEDYQKLVGNDTFYGATAHFAGVQRKYLEADETNESDDGFVDELIEQRRRLFFTVPDEEEGKFPHWGLTVFQHAGKFLQDIVIPLKDGRTVPIPIRQSLVLGLNRIFTGLLVQEHDRICLATSGTHSQARVSRMIEDLLPVDEGQRGEVDIELVEGRPQMVIHGSGIEWPRLPLTLTRFEFIMRVAAGALPTSFSKECFEDLASFKTQLVTTSRTRGKPSNLIRFQILDVSQDGATKSLKIDLKASAT